MMLNPEGSWKHVLVALSLMIVGLCGVANADAFDVWTYSHRMTVAFSGYDRPGALTNFPALVVLGPHIAGFAYEQFESSAGADLRFTACNEMTELNYEIESWDTNGSSCVWVQVPEIENTNTVIYAYWGKPDVTVPACTTNGAVWDANYIGVWHLDQADATDATANGFHGSAQGAVTPLAEALVNGGNTFVRNTDFISIPDSPAFTLGADYSVSAWIRSVPVANAWEGFVGTYNGSGFIFSLRNSANNELSFWAAGTWRYSGHAIADNEWKHVTYTASGTDGRFYVDGIQVGTASGVGINNGGDLHIGAAGTSWAANRFSGDMDEVRISRVARGSNWVWACWLNQASNETFMSYTDALPQAADLFVQSLPVSSLTATSAVFSGVVRKTGAAEDPDVYFCWGPSDAGTGGGTSAWDQVTSLGAAWGQNDPFSTNMTGLLVGGSYVYRVYATNSTGEAWSEPVSFTTRSVPLVENDGVAWVRRRSVLVQGLLASDGGEPSQVWAEYWPDGGAGTAAVMIATIRAGAFETTFAGLDTATHYQFRFGVSNVAGSAWSKTGSFTTLAGEPIAWYVATNGNHMAGTNWTTALQTVQIAAQVAEPGDTIYIAGGTFWANSEVSLEGKTEVALYGSYAATNALATPGPWDFAQWPTVLQRDPAVRTRLMKISSSTRLHLRAIQFQEGRSDNNQGGGMLISDSRDLLFERCRWVDNLAQDIVDNSAGSGGAAYIANSDCVTFIDCRFDVNHALGAFHHSRGLGGALYLQNSTIAVSNSVFAANRAQTTGKNIFYAHSYGGAIYQVSGTLDVFRSVIQSNDTIGLTGSDSLPTRGGGVYVAGGTASLENVLVANNATRSSDALGCGLHLAGGTLHLLNVTVVDNLREGIRRAAGTLTVTNAIVWYNGTRDFLGQQNDFISHTTSETGKSDPVITHGWQGCLTNEPVFFDRIFYHLASEHGCYIDGYFSGGAWSNTVDSCPLIDAGDPSMPVQHELMPNGGLINLGAYGNSPVASKSGSMVVANLPETAWDDQSVVLQAQVLKVDSPPLYARFYYGQANGGSDTNLWQHWQDAGEVFSWPWTVSTLVSGLMPGATYFATCRITNEQGVESWGAPVITFVPKVTLPLLENLGVDNDTGPQVTLRGKIIRPGSSSPPPFVWVVWGPEPGGLSVGDWAHQVAVGTEAGEFATVVTTLPGSNYWFTSFAVNGEGTNWAPAAIPFGNDVVRFVDASATGNGSGYNWQNAYTRLQLALSACENSRTNVLYLKGGAGGTFSGTTMEPLVLATSHVRLLGACEGAVANGAGPRDPAQWPTVLTRESNVELIRPLLISSATNVTVHGVIFFGGETRGSPGGGLRIQSSTQVLIEDCRVVGNKAYLLTDHGVGTGGGVAVVNSANVVLHHVWIADNDAAGLFHHASGHGGGLYVDNSSVVVRHTMITANRVRTTDGNPDWSYGLGGGVYVNSGDLDISRTVIASNTAESGKMSTRGAGVYVNGGAVRLENTLVVANAATSSAAQGSGIQLAGGSLALHLVTLSGNRLEGIRRTGGIAAVTNSIVWGNGADLIGFPVAGQGALENVAWTLIGDGQNHGTNGCFSADPLFVDTTYYHLQSRAGNYEDGYFSGGTWGTAVANSPCLAAGNKASDDSREPKPNGGCVNLGAYGNTGVASKKPMPGSIIMIR